MISLLEFCYLFWTNSIDFRTFKKEHTQLNWGIRNMFSA